MILKGSSEFYAAKATGDVPAQIDALVYMALLGARVIESETVKTWPKTRNLSLLQESLTTVIKGANPPVTEFKKLEESLSNLYFSCKYYSQGLSSRRISLNPLFYKEKSMLSTGHYRVCFYNKYGTLLKRKKLKQTSLVGAVFAGNKVLKNARKKFTDDMVVEVSFTVERRVYNSLDTRRSA